MDGLRRSPLLCGSPFDTAQSLFDMSAFVLADIFAMMLVLSADCHCNSSFTCIANLGIEPVGMVKRILLIKMGNYKSYFSKNCLFLFSYFSCLVHSLCVGSLWFGRLPPLSQPTHTPLFLLCSLSLWADHRRHSHTGLLIR